MFLFLARFNFCIAFHDINTNLCSDNMSITAAKILKIFVLPGLSKCEGSTEAYGGRATENL